MENFQIILRFLLAIFFSKIMTENDLNSGVYDKRWIENTLKKL
jgi:hypothetical protein